MKTYKQGLTEFLESHSQRSVPFDAQVPDNLCGLINTPEDFAEFVQFVSANLDSDYLEFGCDDVVMFVEELHKMYTDPRNKEYAESQGIRSPLGFVAYAIILALGNPMVRL